MDFQYNVSRNYNRINFQNIFGMQFLPSALKEIYDAVVKRSYKSVFGNFSFYSYKKACGQKKTVRGSKNSRRLSNGTLAI